MKQTVTAKLRLYPTEEQAKPLSRTMNAYMRACKHISFRVYDTRATDYRNLHDEMHDEIRCGFGLGAQTTQSAIRTVLAAYQAIESNGHRWTEATFDKPLVDLVRGRDCSFTGSGLSAWTLDSREKIAWSAKGFEQCLNADLYRFGTA